MVEPPDSTSDAVSQQLITAQNLLSEAEQIFATETTTEHRTKWPNVYRLESATEHAQKVLQLASPRVTREAAANELAAAAMQARDAIRAAVDSGGGNLIGSADQLLTAISQIEPALLSPEEAKSAGAFALARLNEIQGEIEGRRNQIDAQISEQNERFAEAETKRVERFDGALTKADAELAQARETFDIRVQEARDHIAELENDIGQTAAALGGRAIAIDNNKESEEQAQKAFRWTVLTVLLLILAVAIPLLIGIENADQSPESVAGKITVGLILAGIASYTAGVARHHRQRAATARRLAIELNAFGPFIAPLEKDDRDDLRSTIVWRFFGPPDAVNQDADAEPMPGSRIVQLLDERRKARNSPEAES